MHRLVPVVGVFIPIYLIVAFVLGVFGIIPEICAILMVVAPVALALSVMSLPPRLYGSRRKLKNVK